MELRKQVKTTLKPSRTVIHLDKSNHISTRHASTCRVDSKIEEHTGKESFAFAPMAYIERGVVKSKKSFWRLRTIADFFLAVVNFISIFFVTLFSMDKAETYRKGSGSGKKWDDGGAPGGPGGGPRRPPSGMSNVRGIDHSAPSACGSCCGG
ncbi:glycine-rich protein [Striga hermonthica]|uniref:Glycine-rich protein n=1 Tax=Striga hermonthica TaxID=68872 RepID=A0A9N7RHA0_STRHE|nr:glycine-rich protein [Striga hermonthica]